MCWCVMLFICLTLVPERLTGTYVLCLCVMLFFSFVLMPNCLSGGYVLYTHVLGVVHLTCFGALQFAC